MVDKDLASKPATYARIRRGFAAPGGERRESAAPHLRLEFNGRRLHFWDAERGQYLRTSAEQARAAREAAACHERRRHDGWPGESRTDLARALNG